MVAENLLIFLILTTPKINYSNLRQNDYVFPSSNKTNEKFEILNDTLYSGRRESDSVLPSKVSDAKFEILHQAVIINNEITNIDMFDQISTKKHDDMKMVSIPTKYKGEILKTLKNQSRKINEELNIPSETCIRPSKRLGDESLKQITQTYEAEPGYMDNKRLIGGKQTTINTFPFQVQVEIDGKLVCAGVIVCDRIVLSVAHCFKDDILNESIVLVRAGTSKRGGIDGVLMPVEKVENHEKFGHSINPFDYDISILWLKIPFKYSTSIRSIPIAKPSEDKSMDLFRTFYVSGWGVEKEGSRNFSDVLSFIEIHIVNWTICNEIYEGILTERMLCAGNLNVDACQGDSGGGLVHNNKLYGIVSWGLGCGRFPGLYTDLMKFRDWIHEKTGLLSED